MKRNIILSVLFTFLILPLAFSQAAKIIDIKGDVRAREAGKVSWQKARIGMILASNSQVKTGAYSECTLAFDDELKNIVTIKESSQITIENIKPGRIFLPEGRVFTLIGELGYLEEFKIRTPTAAAGARGTGWSTGASPRGTDVKCFEDDVFVQGFDPQGNVTDEQGLFSGFGMGVGRDGGLGDPFGLSRGDLNEWRDFKDNAEGKRRGGDRGGQGPQGFGGFGNMPGDDPLDDLKDDQRDSFRDDLGEDFRQDFDCRSGNQVF